MFTLKGHYMYMYTVQWPFITPLPPSVPSPPLPSPPSLPYMFPPLPPRRGGRPLRQPANDVGEVLLQGGNGRQLGVTGGQAALQRSQAFANALNVLRQLWRRGRQHSHTRSWQHHKTAGRGYIVCAR